ncbi:uncharacterized protein B0I36DRAFT_340717 [Microdochium trichocladiopsis]|uniref:Uncharacterized protein n=1 Tax=Microdochium trichocladiopsis TaxID=1682393 RepID=A0A9P8XQS0_9PEZI|nr:uncharacterized protein B0I36DRAFT_343004 [Microdochium trichocladiopsis]XP_046004609.1 uncharacterized protein B0I36DRAFT_340717 [Microdochium trichocladiopsis]KAH7009141.1 hypothetical protein B0I36DRAFT_343004 [Microdochium trichocladiopsis]KAH7012233.1 hypothetical protein B0I36DRAFT_340717 [Microdochium trichocladiopsis]
MCKATYVSVHETVMKSCTNVHTISCLTPYAACLQIALGYGVSNKSKDAVNDCLRLLEASYAAGLSRLAQFSAAVARTLSPSGMKLTASNFISALQIRDSKPAAKTIQKRRTTTVVRPSTIAGTQGRIIASPLEQNRLDVGQHLKALEVGERLAGTALGGVLHTLAANLLIDGPSYNDTTKLGQIV